MTAVALNNLWNYLKGLSLSKHDREWLAGKLIEPIDTEQAEKEEAEPKKRREALPLSPNVAFLSGIHLREFSQEELDADPRLAAIMNDGRPEK